MVHMPAMTGLKRAPDQSRPITSAAYAAADYSSLDDIQDGIELFSHVICEEAVERSIHSPGATGLFCDLAEFPRWCEPSNSMATRAQRAHWNRLTALRAMPDGLDLVCFALSSPIAKNISLPFFRNFIYKPSRLIPLRGAARDRHGRGMRCGGRGSVRHAMGRRADCSP